MQTNHSLLDRVEAIRQRAMSCPRYVEGDAPRLYSLLVEARRAAQTCHYRSQRVRRHASFTSRLRELSVSADDYQRAAREIEVLFRA